MKLLRPEGGWHFGVVLDAETGIPILGHLLPTQTKWACRWFLIKVSRYGIYPQTVITDGLSGYISAIGIVFVNTKHLLYLFHHRQAVTQWAKNHLSSLKSKEVKKIKKKKIKRVVQTSDLRTVLGRLKYLEKEDAKNRWGNWCMDCQGSRKPGAVDSLFKR